ncbi:MAG: hypothetical protein P8Z79_04695 [Sedimentisphaerales bacterium]
MKEHPGKNRSRRELCAGALRYTTLGLLGAGGAALFAKRQRLVREGVCINEGICDGCTVLAQCDLPLALSAKKTKAGEANGG